MTKLDNMSARAPLAQAKKIVVKVGSFLIAENPTKCTQRIAQQLAQLETQGVESVLVSSGAVALGVEILGLAQRPNELPMLQAAAASGQSALVRHWEQAFLPHRKNIAQVLVSHDDLRNRRRFLNARQTLRALLRTKTIPIVNENDTVAVEELRLGDNDLLAALICNLVEADALVVLTDVNGLHTAPPDQGGRRVDLVADVDTAAVTAGGVAAGRPGSGGMATKVQAAKACASFGIPTLVVCGMTPNVIVEAMSGHDHGTLFTPTRNQLSSRKHWIAYGNRPTGTITVDQGAKRAILAGGSLLTPGIVETSGTIIRGDLVTVVDLQKTEFARGLVGTQVPIWPEYKANNLPTSRAYWGINILTK